MKNSLNKIRCSRRFFSALVLLFITEVFIALFAGGIIRHYVGDILVVILIYCGVRTLYNGKTGHLPLWVFCFAVLVEVMQYLNIADRMSIDQGSALGIAIGSSFDWVDIGCYAVGCGVCCFIQRNGKLHAQNAR